MAARARMMGADYPFMVHEVAVRARPAAAATTYVALLLLSSGSVARQLLYPVPTSEMAVLFERLSAHALARLWGQAGQALRFGWPSDVGRPQDFPSAVTWLAGQLGVVAGSGYRPPRRKDGGVDVVAWRPFPDGRPGFPIVLAQCTLQAELMSKAADVDVRLWSSWLALDFEPTTALVIPGTVQERVVWDQLALRSMVLDRLRLTVLAGSSGAATTTTSSHEGGTAEGSDISAPASEPVPWVLSTLEQLAPVLEEAR